MWDQVHHKNKGYATYKIVQSHNLKAVLLCPPKFRIQYDTEFLLWDYESWKEFLIRRSMSKLD